MHDKYFVNAAFEGRDYVAHPMVKGEYECCKFYNCNFTEADIAAIKFIDCTFNLCDLSMAKLSKSVFQKTKFIDCKLLGLRFDQCDSFMLSLYFDNCSLNYSSFYELKLNSIQFDSCILHEVDFTQTDLTYAVFKNCDFHGAIFDQTNLERADLSTSFNYLIDPLLNQIKRAKFSVDGLPGLLDNYGIEIV